LDVVTSSWRSHQWVSIMLTMQNRRRFLATLSSVGAAGLMGTTASFPQDAPPEIASIRIAKNSTICIAPQYIADDLLRTEGFTDIQYVERAPAILSAALGRGEVDFLCTSRHQASWQSMPAIASR